MILRRSVEPALKWALRDLRREAARPVDMLDRKQLVVVSGAYLERLWSCWRCRLVKVVDRNELCSQDYSKEKS